MSTHRSKNFRIPDISATTTPGVVLYSESSELLLLA